MNTVSPTARITRCCCYVIGRVGKIRHSATDARRNGAKNEVDERINFRHSKAKCKKCNTVPVAAARLNGPPAYSKSCDV